MTRRSRSTPMLLRGAACLAFTFASTGATCDTRSTGDDDEDTGALTDTDTDENPATETMGTTATPTSSTTSPSTSTSSTTASTTSVSDTTPLDTSSSSGSTFLDCLEAGEWVVELTDREDPFGHFPFLKLFYAPAEPEQTTPEVFFFDFLPDGTVTVSFAPRAPGSGEGHAGLADMQGTIDENCEVAIEAQVPFESDTGPFGTVDVTLVGNFTAFARDLPPPSGSLTLQGGNIPRGPIHYEVMVQAADLPGP